MKVILIPLFGTLLPFLLESFSEPPTKNYSLSIEVDDLRNENGNVQFALYNKNGSIPDEHYKKYYKIGTADIIDGKSIFTFNHLPEGSYAVNILHDENKNGKIDKRLIIPKEGIGFSNFKSIGFTNRPSFLKASFILKSDWNIKVKVIYM